MKAILRTFVLAALVPALMTAAAPAQRPPKPAPLSPGASVPAPKQKFFYHYEWTRGAVLSGEEWERGAAVNAGRSHLPAAPSGDEWREIDGNYVLASRATHAIVRVVAAPHPTVAGRSGGQP